MIERYTKILNAQRADLHIKTQRVLPLLKEVCRNRQTKRYRIRRLFSARVRRREWELEYRLQELYAVVSTYPNAVCDEAYLFAVCDEVTHLCWVILSV